MQIGEIATLVRERGFGFIMAQDGRRCFFHRSMLPDEVSFGDLTEGQAVELEYQEGEKGPRVTKFQLVSAAGERST